MSDGPPRLVAALVALVALVAGWVWWQSSEEPGRPILRPNEFVSHDELAEFVGERLGPGAGMGSRYSYVVRTIPSSDGHILVEAVYVEDGLPAMAPPPPETGPGGVRMGAGVDDAELTQMLVGRLNDDSRSGYGVCQ